MRGKAISCRFLTTGNLVLLCLLMVITFGCKEKDASQDAQEQAAVKRVEKIVTADQNELIDSDGKIKLRILCTTSPKEGRTADFVSFLSKYFVKVETTDYKSFREDLAEDFDVVIIDYGIAPVHPLHSSHLPTRALRLRSESRVLWYVAGLV